jgi:hypothetical protein
MGCQTGVTGRISNRPVLVRRASSLRTHLDIRTAVRGRRRSWRRGAWLQPTIVVDGLAELAAGSAGARAGRVAIGLGAVALDAVGEVARADAALVQSRMMACKEAQTR